MFSALLLPLLAGAPAVLAAVAHDDPPIQIWISNDRYFRPGDRAKVQVRTREDGYLLVLHSDPDGHLRVLFPTDPSDDNFVRGGHKYEIRGRGGRESFSVDGATGRGTVYAAVSRDPFHFDGYVLSDHWDYRALAPNRLPREPESELNELVRQVAQGNFDYDILSYDVLERAYADNYYSYDPYYSPLPYYGSYYGYPYGSSFSFNLIFGRPYRRAYFYDPFYAGFDPFYDPFFYDPYYYRSFYYRPIYYYDAYYPIYRYPYRTHYYGRYNHGYYYNPRFNNYNRSYTPYRVRQPDGFTEFGARRYTFARAVNTVYLPPTSKASRSLTSTPGRRVMRPEELTAQPPPEAHREHAEARRSATGRGSGAEARRAAPSNRSEVSGDVPAPSVDHSRIQARRARPELQRDLPSEARPASRDNQPRGAPRRFDAERGSAPERYSGDRGGDRGSDRGGDRGDRGGGRVERQAPPQQQSAPSDRGRDSGAGGRDSGARRR